MPETKDNNLLTDGCCTVGRYGTLRAWVQLALVRLIFGDRSGEVLNQFLIMLLHAV